MVYCSLKFIAKEAPLIKPEDSRRDSDLLTKEPRVEAPNKKKNRGKKPHHKMKVVAVLLSIVLFFEALYCFVVFTDISAIKNLREMYIETALSTMSHQWLARAFLPSYMVNQVQSKTAYLMQLQSQQNSNRPSAEPVDPNVPTTPNETSPIPTNEPTEMTDEEAFYELFWELNRTSFEDYLDEHPEALDNGWNNIYINESAIYEDGTEIYTSMGEQVLAIDAKNKILLVRVKGTGYLGVLAIAKDPAQLRCAPSAGIGSYGQSLHTIVQNSDGILGMTGSGFIDPGGGGNGGELAGYAMCEGKSYGNHYYDVGYKRIELTQDNKMYITNASDEVASDVTDAVEFSPALIVDGNLVVNENWNSNNPRACIGQSERGEILMLVIEGRQATRSIGTDVETCAKILLRHEGYTAMNLDGGTSAVMWFDGEYVTKCSNQDIQSRSLPNAWVYGNYE